MNLEMGPFDLSRNFNSSSSSWSECLDRRISSTSYERAAAEMSKGWWYNLMPFPEFNQRRVQHEALRRQCHTIQSRLQCLPVHSERDASQLLLTPIPSTSRFKLHLMSSFAISNHRKPMPLILGAVSRLRPFNLRNIPSIQQDINELYRSNYAYPYRNTPSHCVRRAIWPLKVPYATRTKCSLTPTIRGSPRGLELRRQESFGKAPQKSYASSTRITTSSKASSEDVDPGVGPVNWVQAVGSDVDRNSYVGPEMSYMR